MRRTKIIATVGPASSSDAALDELIAAGVDIFRLNFSHATHEAHAAAYERVRRLAEKAGRHVAILQDLGGPKIRTGTLANGQPVELRSGQELIVATGDFPGTASRISTTFDGLARGVHPGDCLLLADGVIALRVEATNGREIRTTVVDGGSLGEHKGITAPGVDLSASAITLKDADDLRFGLALGVDMVAISFVQSADDLRQARDLLEGDDSDAPVVAKLERPKALERLDSILEVSDAVMVARGDLGLELPLEQVPRAQKAIVRRARARQIPVILATQVLESMTTESRPTRAEVSDAANGVEDGVDAIMLSGETAIGVDPARVVRTLDAIIRDAESAHVDPSPTFAGGIANDHTEALCEAAARLADRARAAAIVAVTRGGKTARHLSALRPRAPIVATTDRPETARRLALYRGVFPVCTSIGETVDEARQLITPFLMDRELVKPGEAIVLVSINPDLTRSAANYVQLIELQ
ncbi:MAG TPA: pyruvate kinase [Vicinamibacterales bacterium]|nr:pyruvate kinase [Vicinamibacterales bacterium]